MGHRNAASTSTMETARYRLRQRLLQVRRSGRGSFGTVFSHGGHGILAENNIFIECKRALGSARGACSGSSGGLCTVTDSHSRLRACARPSSPAAFPGCASAPTRSTGGPLCGSRPRTPSTTRGIRTMWTRPGEIVALLWEQDVGSPGRRRRCRPSSARPDPRREHRQRPAALPARRGLPRRDEPVRRVPPPRGVVPDLHRRAAVRGAARGVLRAGFGDQLVGAAGPAEFPGFDPGPALGGTCPAAVHRRNDLSLDARGRSGPAAAARRRRPARRA